MDEHVKYSKDVFTITHDGKMAVGNIGSARKKDVIEYVRSRCSELVDDNKNRIFLGALKNDDDLKLSIKDVQDFVGRLLKYALLRDEYRAIVKKHPVNKNTYSY